MAENMFIPCTYGEDRPIASVSSGGIRTRVNAWAIRAVHSIA